MLLSATITMIAANIVKLEKEINDNEDEKGEKAVLKLKETRKKRFLLISCDIMHVYNHHVMSTKAAVAPFTPLSLTLWINSAD